MNPAPPAPFALSQIGQVALTVSDVARSTLFYRDVLGLKHLFSAPPGLAFFAAEEVRLMLAVPEKGQTPAGNSVIYFKVSEIETAQRELEARGAHFEGKPHCVAKLLDHELWMSFLRDPDKNLLGLMCEKR